jgi:hypothetical protein
MPISFQCSQCGKKLKAPESAAGKSSTCPGCGAKVTCPEPVYDAEVIDLGEPSEPPPGFNAFADLDDDKAHGGAIPSPADEPVTESRRPCPMCGEMIVATAAKCRYCGEIFDSTLKKAKKSGGKKGELRKIATSQKSLVMSILVFILSYIGLIAATVAMQPRGGGPPQPGGALTGIVVVLALFVLVASLASWVLSVMLASKLYGTGGAVLVLLLQFIPCVNLITLLVVNNKATNLLRDKGHTVGFLGADLSEFQ